MVRLSNATSAQLLILFLGYGLAGWLLSAYGASIGIWLIVEAMILHLAWAGTSAIALAIVGIVSIVLTATFSMSWFTKLPWMGVSTWAIVLVCNWGLALTLVVKLALVAQRLNLKSIHKFRIVYLLVFVTNLGLALGHLVQLAQ